MGDVLSAIVVAAIALGALVAFLAAMYWVAGRLPRGWQEGARAWVFLVPTAIAVTIGLLIPGIRTAYLSLLDDNGKEFVGLDNYVAVFSTTGTRLTVFNSLTWVLVGTIATVAVGLAVARFADGMRIESAAKSAIFLPGAISLVGTGLIWGFVYAGPPFEVGLLNEVTGSLPSLPDNWGGSGERLWLLERGYGRVDPPDTAPGVNTFPAHRRIYLGAGRHLHGDLLGGDQGRARLVDRGGQGRWGHGPSDVLPGDAALHSLNGRDRCHAYHHRRPKGFRYRRRHHWRTFRHQHDRQ